jgi:GNAT superfamily N-acetyltransferase
MTPSQRPRLAIRRLTLDRWADFERLFGPRGACGGCWCMWWRLTRSEFERRKGPGNKRAMKALVRQGVVPGLVAYLGPDPVGWVAVAPRESFSALARSRVLCPVDAEPVWSIVCFFIAKTQRRQGLSTLLLEAAVGHVKRQGGRIVEGYPVEPKEGRTADVFAYTGLASAFRRAGFREVARRSPTRPIMRRSVAP